MTEMDKKEYCRKYYFAQNDLDQTNPRTRVL